MLGERRETFMVPTPVIVMRDVPMVVARWREQLTKALGTLSVELDSTYVGRVDKPDSQIGKILIQGSFGRRCRDPWVDERSGMVLS